MFGKLSVAILVCNNIFKTIEYMIALISCSDFALSIPVKYLYIAIDEVHNAHFTLLIRNAW